ncbi:MAG TPA: hypothetical protein VHR17_03430 [Thermoanaerobaculia bacterium]|nr:hypothetical protein [Thermoanaerobaculia bacterium]
MQDHPELDVAVYAVWFSMVDTDERERWQPGLLDDPRVRHFWDEGKVAGRWFAAHDQTLGVDFEGETLWDVFFVFSRDARWNELPTAMTAWGRPVIQEKRMLRRAVLAAAKARVP